MNPFEKPAADLLESARTRGNKALEGVVLPSGLEHFTVYAGLIGSALELAKLIQTEQRDLTVIDSHYKLARANMEAAFSEVEKAMQSDFNRDESLKAKTFEAITQLIAAGQYDIASTAVPLMLFWRIAITWLRAVEAGCRSGNFFEL
jgi:hypothetical protein